MNQQSDLTVEWRTVQQKTLSSIYGLNFSFKLDQNVKLTSKNRKKVEFLANNQYFLTQLVELVNKLNLQINWLFNKAKQHDYTGQQANGYYSMIRILLSLFKLLSKRFKKLDEKSSLRSEVLDILNVIIYFIIIIDNMIMMFDKHSYQDYTMSNDLKSLFTLSIDNFIDLNLLSLHEDAQKALSIIYGPLGVFWYSKSMKNYFKAFRLMLIGCTSNPFRFLHCLMSEKACGQNLARKTSNSTIEYVTRSLQALDMKAYNRTYFSLIYLNKTFRYSAKTVHVKVSTSYQVPTKNLNDNLTNDDNNNTLDCKHIKLISEINERKVRCRLISGFTKSFIKKICNKNKITPKELNLSNLINPLKAVVLHVHGGGFCVTTPDSHEIYLRKWSTKLNGIPILSIDYKLRAAYPSAIQGDEINYAEKLFGFQPENVILVGDSCGGNLQLSLLCSLNDIRRQKLNNLKFLMPFALTAIYPVFDLRCVCSPSKLGVGSLDPILPNTNLMALHGTYGGLTEGALHCKSIVNRLKNRHVKPWFLCNDQKCASKDKNQNSKNKKSNNDSCVNRHVESRFIQMNEHLDTPFASPAIYEYFDDFKDIKINLITTHICPLLDDSIEMYRKWPGAKTINIFDNLPHGFIQFIDLSPSCKKAANQIVQIINTTIDDRFSELNNTNTNNNTNNNNNNNVNNNNNDYKLPEKTNNGKIDLNKDSEDRL